MNYSATTKMPRRLTFLGTLLPSLTQMMLSNWKRELAQPSLLHKVRSVTLWFQLRLERKRFVNKLATLAWSSSHWTMVTSLNPLKLSRLSFHLRLLTLLLSSAPTTRKFHSWLLAKISVRDKRYTDHLMAQSLLKTWRMEVKTLSTIVRSSFQASPNRFNPKLFWLTVIPRRRVESPIILRQFHRLCPKRSKEP